MSQKILPEALIKVRFLLPKEGGRQNNIKIDWPSGQQTGFGCPMRIDGCLHDFRTIISGSETYILGETYDLYVKFLCPELALPKLRKGMEIELWAGKTIARGHVMEIIHHQILSTEKKANAILQWLRPEEGGRILPPAGPCFFAVGRVPEFEPIEKWEKEAWTLKIQFITQPDDTLTHNVKVSFLMDEAPDYLRSNCLFELYEGKKIIAKGKVLHLETHVNFLSPNNPFHKEQPYGLSNDN